ncbi:MAG: tol-pal system protein YbgF [Burkholderiales bacterium]|nr:tol-pal system protein YbgF [Burkholderiales bacterium]MDE2433198.1 tol-pal system protein YbgF [Burkholderiales bacterium]
MRALKVHRAGLSSVLLAVLFVMGTPSAHAGLLEDDEARQAILDLRQQRATDNEDLAKKLKGVGAQMDALRGSLLDLNSQIDQMRSDLANLRGQNEVLAKQLADVQQRQKDMQQAMEKRARETEPVQVDLDGKSFKAEPDEKKQFEDALTKFRSQDFAGAAAALNAFMQKYPSTGYKESALYWLGNAYYGATQYKDAIAAFKQLIAMTPDHARAPEAMLSIANCYSELKETKLLRKTLNDVIKQYPQSEAAQAAKDRIATTPALRGEEHGASAKSKSRK